MASYLKSCSPYFGIMVNSLLTISIKVNVPVSDMSRRETTGDKHEEGYSPDPRALELAFRAWLEHGWRPRLIEFLAVFGRYFKQLDDLRLGADRLFACAND